MECKIGDVVRFLDDVGGGVIARFIDKKTVAVRDEDGFEIPVSISNVVLVQAADERKLDAQEVLHKDTAAFFRRKGIKTPSDTAEPEELPSVITEEVRIEEKTPEYLVSGGADERKGSDLSFYLGFISVEEEQMLDVYLINDASYRCFVVLSEYLSGNGAKALFAGFIEADTKLLMTRIPKDYFRVEKDWGLAFLPFKNVDFQTILPDIADIHLNPLKFFRQGCFQSNDFFDEDALVIQVYASEKVEE